MSYFMVYVSIAVYAYSLYAGAYHGYNEGQIPEGMRKCNDKKLAPWSFVLPFLINTDHHKSAIVYISVNNINMNKQFTPYFFNSKKIWYPFLILLILKYSTCKIN